MDGRNEGGSFLKRMGPLVLVSVYAASVTIAYAFLYRKFEDHKLVWEKVELSRNISHSEFYLRILNDYYSGTMEEVLPNLEVLTLGMYHSIYQNRHLIETNEKRERVLKVMRHIAEYETAHPESWIANGNQSPFWQEEETALRAYLEASPR